MLRLLGKFLRKIVGKVAARPVRRQLLAFELATLEPRRQQEAVLQRILAHQADTDFGRAHHFHAITGPADFRHNVPLLDYEALEPTIRQVRAGRLGALLADPAVLMFALTSGTTAARKYIPVTAQYLADYRRGWNVWGLRVFDDHKSTRLRPIVQISGDHEELYTESGVPCGAVTGLTATVQKRIIRFLYCVPACVGKVKDAAAKYYLVLRLSVPRRVGMVVAANPSTLVGLARAGDQEKEALIRDIHDGTLSQRFDVPPAVRAAV